MKEQNDLTLYHKTTLQDDNLALFNKASFEGFEILRYELLSDKTFMKSKCPTTRRFTYQNKIYQFFVGYTGVIDGFFELNTDIDKCVNGPYGVYFKLINKR